MIDLFIKVRRMRKKLVTRFWFALFFNFLEFQCCLGWIWNWETVDNKVL